MTCPLPERARQLLPDAGQANGTESPSCDSGPSTNHQEAQRWITVVDGYRLRELRRERGLTQVELAWQAQVSRAAVARLERKPRVSCRSRTMARLAAALGADPVTFMWPPDP